MQEREMALKNTVLKTLVGSHLYGTSTPESDLDHAAIFVPNKEYILGTKTCEIVEIKSNPADSGKRNTKDDFDLTLYSLPKYIHLASQSNPNIIEILFSPDYEILHPIGKELIKNRGLFLSTLARKTFLGYAKSQIMKLTTKKSRLDAIRYAREYVRLLSKDHWRKDLSSPLNVTDNIHIYKIYETGQTFQYVLNDLNKLEEEYGLRTKSIEEHGYDCKFASHIFRLMFEGMELLQEGKITFPFIGKQLEFIMDVKEGRLNIKDIMAFATEAEQRLQNCESILPDYVDEEAISDLQIKLLSDFWKEQESVNV